MEWITSALRSFLDDPADTDYQKGYLAAHLDMYQSMKMDTMMSEDLDKLEKQTQE